MSSGTAYFHPIPKPIASLTVAMPLSSYQFYAPGTFNQAVVYRDAYLLVPYNGQPQADEAGNFEPIYLDPKMTYRVRLVDLAGAVQYDLDPYIPPTPTTGTGPIQVNPVTGEVQINPPLGNTVTLSVNRNNTYAISCPGQASTPGLPLLQFQHTLGTGGRVATFVAANKPGVGTTAPSQWLPIAGDGGIIYYIPLWA